MFPVFLHPLHVLCPWLRLMMCSTARGRCRPQLVPHHAPSPTACPPPQPPAPPPNCASPPAAVHQGLRAAVKFFRADVSPDGRTAEEVAVACAVVGARPCHGCWLCLMCDVCGRSCGVCAGSCVVCVGFQLMMPGSHRSNLAPTLIYFVVTVH